MKTENGHETTESLPWNGLSSQVASAVGELLRAQQELEGRGKAVDEREHEIAERERTLQERASEIARRAADLERAEADVRERTSTLDERERSVAEREAQADDLGAREQEQCNREANVLLREREISRREAQLVDVSAEEARIAEREQALASERAAYEESAAALTSREAELEASCAKLAQREKAFETVCAMLQSMTAALREPTPENISAALEATSKAKEVRPALAGSTEASVPVAMPVDEPTTPQVPIEAADTETRRRTTPDISDLSDEELARMRMLQQLGTASIADILATIREERSASGCELPKRKRRLGFLK